MAAHDEAKNYITPYVIIEKNCLEAKLVKNFFIKFISSQLIDPERRVANFVLTSLPFISEKMLTEGFQN